ncbi:hypothetical protein KSS87_012611 [Heliosperma pusillum]|nr:hypothetical protein KSS87_012611 [Heliosperma pusillum]
MAYMQRPDGTTYYESRTEVIHEPYDSYSSGYPQQRRQNGAGGVVGQVVGAIVKNIIPGSHGRNNNNHQGEVIERREERICENIIPGSYGHHHNHQGEVIERREERMYENGYGSYGRVNLRRGKIWVPISEIYNPGKDKPTCELAAQA